MTLKSLDEGRPEDVRVVVWTQEDLDSASADIFQAEMVYPLIEMIHRSDFESGNLEGWDWATGG